MPIVHIYSPLASPPSGLLESMCAKVARHLELPEGYMWAMWQELEPGNFFRPTWVHGSPRNGPIAIVYCKTTYTVEQVAGMLTIIRDSFVEALGCKSEDVYAAAQRVYPGEVMGRGEIWRDV